MISNRGISENKRRMVFLIHLSASKLPPLAVDLGLAKAGGCSLHPPPPPLPLVHYHHLSFLLPTSPTPIHDANTHVHQERHNLDAFKRLLPCYRREFAGGGIEG